MNSGGFWDCAGTDAAVSELIGAIVLTAVIVAGVSIIGVALWSQPPPLKVPALSAVIYNQSCRVDIYHNGGDVLDRQGIRIFIDGVNRTADIQKKGDAGTWTRWINGDTLEYAPATCTQTPKRVDILYSDGTAASVISTAFFGTYQPPGLTSSPTPTPTPTLGFPWYSCSWSSRKYITIDRSKVSGSHTNFPVLISLASDPDLAANARSDGFDILFTSTDGTKLPHEIETFTKSNGALVVWVRVPAVTSSADTTILMYYGNPSSPDQQNKNIVWDANYKAVWHLSEDPSGAAPQMLDSTSNAYHGTSAGTMTPSDQVPAKINGGVDFDGSDDYLSTNYIQTGVTAYTIEAWIKTSTTSMQRVIVHDRGSGAGRSLTLSIGGTYPGGPGVAGGVGYGVDSDNIYIGRYSTTTVNNNNWHHLAGVWTAPPGTAVAPAQFSVYIDGTPAATTDATIGTAPVSPLTGLSGTLIARHVPWNTYLPAILDEVRISDTVRNADWILTEYNNQNNPPMFYTVGSQQQWTC